MEDKKRRLELADNIYSNLVVHESEAMNSWRTQEVDIKLKGDNLPTIDVLTCVYNAEQYIGNAIECVLMQSYPNIHLVIVTDPCTDRTIDIIKEYQNRHSNITLIENPTHEGIIPCFNTGLKHCKNDFIARMDLDDLIHPIRFEKQMDFLNANPEIGVISCYMQIFNEKFEIKNVTYREDFDLQKITMLFYSPLSHAGSIFRAHVIQSIGYRDDYKYAEDFDLWFQIMNRFKTAVLPEFLYLYRTHSNQVTNERNLNIFKSSWFRIMQNLFNVMGLEHTDDDIKFHIDHVLLITDFANEEEWSKYHNWLEKIVTTNAKTGYFNQDKLVNFIYNGYWQTPFRNTASKLGFGTLVKHTFSLLNQQSSIQKIKYIIKHIIKK